jgi:hypothetical protein
MPAKQSPARSRVVCVATIACVASFLVVSLAVSTARGQSDAAAAPWQAHPYEGQEVPPPDKPCDCGGSCGLGLGGGRACDVACGDESCNEECNVATDWLRVFEPRGQLAFHGEYLAWWTKSTDYPALVTTNPDAATPRSRAGVLDASGTEILYSGSDGDSGMHSGVRFSMSYWLTPCHETALDVTYTTLGNSSATFDRSSAQNAILARPYYNVASAVAAQDAWLLAYTNDGQTGEIHITNTQELNFLEAAVRCSIVKQSNRNLDFMFGYRYGRFAEALAINDSTTYLGSTTAKSDVFEARNEFNGFEMGFVSTTRYCRWSLDVLAKLAMGNTRSRVDIAGNTNVTDALGNTVHYAGGLLALPSNSVPVERNNFSAIPELGFTLGYDLTCRLKATVGYSFVYWSGVMRPADQIDTNVNGTQVPPTSGQSGVSAPESKAVTTDFWAQGINLGLDYRY